MFQDVLPFKRGTTATEGLGEGDGRPTTAGTVGSDYLGREYVVEHADPVTGAKISGLPVRLRVMKNSLSSGACLPGVLYTTKTDGTIAQNLSEVASAAAANAPLVVVADEYLPATGAANGSIFYGVVQGPTRMKTAASGSNTVAVNGAVICSGSGLVVAADLGPTTSTVALTTARGIIGYATEAVGAATTTFGAVLSPRV